VHEATLSIGTNVWRGRGYAEMAYIHRRTTSMVEDFFTIADGFTNVPDSGTFTNRVFRNTDMADRAYQALVFQSRYNVSGRWLFSGHYTVQLENDGNLEGEAPNQPGVTSIIGNYPEAFNARRHYPGGKLANFQRHRLRVWSVYTRPLDRYGDVSISGLWRVDSGRPYSLVATSQPLTPTQRQIIAAAGYPNPPSSGGNVFFGERGSERFKGAGLFDLSLNYHISVYRSVQPWVKLDIYNLFNNQKLTSWNTVVAQDPDSPRDELGLATGYIEHPAFGQAQSNANFPAPFGGQTGGRTTRVSVGFTF